MRPGSFLILILTSIIATFAIVGTPRTDAQGPGENDVPPGVDVQARGPVHEAFAQPNRNEATPGPIVTKPPPRPIEELPPEEKPDGENIVWIPGYWSYDDETQNFVWISGFWRAVPPGRTWVPGSWQKVGAGYRWVSGYWAVAGQEEIQYLPPPPPSVDNGPSTPIPGENFSYVPGTWVYQTTRYVWSPGYWLPFRPGWCWIPPCYRWTPCGYIFVPGYWDVPLLDRGLLFAPVAFNSAVYLEPGFVYRPVYCIQPDFLCGALFIRRGFGCYYFGDYFGPAYRSSFIGWNSFRFGGGVGFDLNFCYYRNSFRGFPAWERGLNGLYAGRFAGTIAAPPRTLIQQRTVINNINVNRITNTVVNKNVNITNLQNATVLAPVKNINKVNVTALSSLAGAEAAKAPAVAREVRVARLSPNQLAEEKRQVARYNTIARERRNTEERLVAKAPTAPTAQPIRAKLELPKDTPPPRIVKTPVPPPAPGRGRPEVRPNAPDVTTPTVKPAETTKGPGTRPATTRPEIKPTAPTGVPNPAGKPASGPNPLRNPGGVNPTSPPDKTFPPATKPGMSPPATKPVVTPPSKPTGGDLPPASKPATPGPATKPGTAPPATKPTTPGLGTSGPASKPPSTTSPPTRPGAATPVPPNRPAGGLPSAIPPTSPGAATPIPPNKPAGGALLATPPASPPNRPAAGGSLPPSRPAIPSPTPTARPATPPSLAATPPAVVPVRPAMPPAPSSRPTVPPAAIPSRPAASPSIPARPSMGASVFGRPTAPAARPTTPPPGR